MARCPFDAETPFDLLLHHIGTMATPPREASPALGISHAMSELVMKALDKNPARRFQTGEEMASALEHPAVRVQEKPPAAAQGSAQIFGTAALAAAAAAPSVEEGQQAQTAKTMRAEAVGVATVVTPSPSAQTVRTAAVTAKNEPVYERTLPMGSEYETAKKARLAGWRWRKWALATAGSAAALAVLWAGFFLSQSDSSVEAKFVPASSPAIVERTSTGNSRSSSSRRQPATSSPAPRRSVDPGGQARAQVFVAQGYRRMEKQDFRGAEEAFTQALELDPENAAAQRGLQAARTGQTVKGIAGVFGR